MFTIGASSVEPTSTVFHATAVGVKRDYFSSVSPLIVKNHVIVGVGGDFLDVPNFAEARDPETGDVQWHFWTTAHKGDPGFKTWPN